MLKKNYIFFLHVDTHVDTLLLSKFLKYTLNIIFYNAVLTILRTLLKLLLFYLKGEVSLREYG